jgi:hypothetical protein
MLRNLQFLHIVRAGNEILTVAVLPREAAPGGANDREEAGMAELDNDIAAFERMRTTLEGHHMGKWVVVHSGELTGAFDSFDHAAAEAVRLFGRGPYLIRQVGAPPMTLPASVMYHPIHGAN